MFALLLASASASVSPAAPPPAFTAERASSAESVSGAVAKFGADFAVTFAGQTPALPAGDLLSLYRSDLPRPSFPADAQVILANGDRIAAAVTGGNGLSLTVKTSAGNGQAVGLPLTAVTAVWVVPPPAETPPDVGRYPWVDATKKQDAMLLRNGDVVRGRVEQFSADGATLRFQPTGEKAAKPYAVATVAAVAFDPSLARVRKPKGPFARVVTADGSRVSFATLLADDAVVTGTTVTGAKMSFPLAELIAVDVVQGKAVELSELKPKAVKEEGFNGVAWPWVADRSARGNPLRLTTARGEEVFDRGLGTHSKTTLTYDLAGKYKRFEAVVGLDAATGRKGAVDVRVLADGKEVKIDGLIGLSAAAGAKTIRVDVGKAKELTLVVDYGTGGDVQDDVNWVQARLVE